MRAKPADYLHQLQQLLPTGIAWPRDMEATLTKLLSALADSLSRSHNRTADLIDESDPRTTTEMLPDWETTLGLPDACSAAATTLQERRAALLAKLTSRGGQSRQFFIDLAATLGFEVTITEFGPFLAGVSAAGDACGTEEWRFVWRVNAPAETIHEVSCEEPCEDPIRYWGNELLECAITRLKPAHTSVLFGYGG